MGRDVYRKWEEGTCRKGVMWEGVCIGSGKRAHVGRGVYREGEGGVYREGHV